ncbi:hypothetical protein EI555_005499, partial [Monodon monoceros]
TSSDPSATMQLKPGGAGLRGRERERLAGKVTAHAAVGCRFTRASFDFDSRGVGQFRWQKRPQLLPVGPLGRSMQWCLLLLWAQGLRQALLPASGAVTGRIVTTGNISAEEGGSVTLQCHLSSTTAKVTQVNWKQQDQVLAIHHASLGWHIDPAFMERMVPGPNLGLTLQSLTRNDTGEYVCIYHTYPDGIYKGTVFLEVLQSSVAEHSAGFQIPLLGALATVLAVIGTAVIVVLTLARKSCKTAVIPHIHSKHTCPEAQESLMRRLLLSHVIYFLGT